MSDNNKLKLSTRKSLYDPIEIEVDEKIYQSIKLTHDIALEIADIVNQISLLSSNKKAVEAVYKFVEIVFNVPREILNKLEKREVEDIYIYTNTRLAEIEKERVSIVNNSIKKAFPQKKEAKETIPKNRKRPGDKV